MFPQSLLKPSKASLCVFPGQDTDLNTYTRAHFRTRWKVSLKPPHAHYICRLSPFPFLLCISPFGFVASRLGQLGSFGCTLVPVQPTLAQLRKAGMSRTGTLRVKALTRRLRSSVRRTTSLWSLTVPSVHDEIRAEVVKSICRCVKSGSGRITYFSHWA